MTDKDKEVASGLKSTDSKERNINNVDKVMNTKNLLGNS